ncbi:UNVERIFIED_CONTAM: Arginyl-tRNA--protein transferase 1 [Sesamum angustifolium]|uniref:Arginyl-tRNA--protein transferase 1 n=1 Tax=Sesamum angustifolium TaxID=2727405 RepID=A0AAW2PV27_9LAMI
MPSNECNLFCFHLILLLFLHCSSSFISHALDSETDRLSLLSFKDELTDDPLDVMSSWNDSVRFCEWRGITCSSRRARVTMLSLPFQKLGGTLSPAIANLTFLRVIDLRGNVFRGPIPAEIGRLFRLRLIGKIPTELSRLPNLVALHISANQLTGGIPPVLGNISTLLNLSIAQNYLGGTIPDNLGQLVNLQFLQVGSNNLFGTVPLSVFNLSRISIFGVAFNRLEISRLRCLISSLQIIDLPDNQFVGRVPSDFGRIANLQRDPSTIGNLTKLFELRLDGNTLDTSIPSSLANCQQLQLLNLSDNHLSGPVPIQIFTLSSLTVTFNLAQNFLSGTLPLDVGNFVNLKELDLSDNELSGSIPHSLGRCLSLEHVYLQCNSLNGSIPSRSIPQFLQDFLFLQYLNLSYNQFQGQVPKNGAFANRSAVSLVGNGDLCGGSIELELPPCSVPTNPVGRNKSYLKVVIAAVSGVFGSAGLLYIAISCILKRSRARSSLTFPSSDWNSNFSYRELEKATSGFSSDNLVGTGGFALVYKGLQSQDRRPIAVKVLKIQEKGISKIYIAECEALSNIRHRNLVKVLGCCSDVDSAGRDFKAIVLDFMPNGPLELWLHPEERNVNAVNDLNIFQRPSIAIDVASALEYLHYYCHIPIAHCDLKPGNVLLDDDLCAHLSDFGLAKFLRKRVDVCGQAQSSSVGILGSVGYVAPEYGMGGAVSISGDVYSYGILLLEMFTGKRPTDELFRDGLSLHEHAKIALSLNQVMNIVNPTLLLLKADGGGEATDTSRMITEQEKALVISTEFELSHFLSQDRIGEDRAMAEAKKMRSEASTSGSGGNGGRGESVVMDVGRRKSTCGYCKSGARTSISHALLDRGWRRSGCFLYKPDMEKTCCPSYTIRLKASDFVPSKEQIRVSKRMQRFLDGTLDVKKTDKLTDELNTSGGSCSTANNEDTSFAAMESSVVDCKGKDKADQLMRFLSDEIDNTVQLFIKSGEFSSDQLPKASVKKVAPAKRKLQAENSEELIFSCNIAFQIAATVKRLKKDAKPTKSSEHDVGGKGASGDLSSKMIAEILAGHLKQPTEFCGLSVRACNGHINFYSATQQKDLVEVGRVLESSPTANCANDKHLKKSCRGPQGQHRRFEIRLKRSSFDYEEYSLYRKYQLIVHNDTPDHVTESSYKRFLVDTPLVHIEPNDDNAVPPCGYGSFHQQYLVDGKLIAVGVIDILPKCLSSKYLFWDPDLAFLSLGKYSALEEIRWVSENQVHCPSLQYYYLGYYIHSCSKMRYKAAYRPSELLCPLRYQWVPYDIAKPFLDRRKYVVLSDYSTLQNGGLLPQDVLVNMEEQQHDFAQEASNDVSINEEEMAEVDSDSSDSDDESDSEAGAATSLALEDVDLSNVLFGVRGARLRYKDLQHAFDPSQRRFMENQLQRYVRVVGTELSKQMVYNLG